MLTGSKASRKALIIGLVLVAVNQLSGCFAFINYTAEIFMESGSSLTPNMSAIVVAVIQVVGSTISTLAIGKLSRKLLYAITGFGTIAGLLTFGIHGYLKTYYNMEDFAWVPIASLSFVIFIASIGLLPMTFVMLSEILPQKVSELFIEGMFDKVASATKGFESLATLQSAVDCEMRSSRPGFGGNDLQAAS